MAPDQLIALSRQLIAAADQKKITIRLLGGAAVRLSCPSAESHPGLQRDIADADFITSRSDFAPAVKIFEEQGLVKYKSLGNRIFFEKGGSNVELADPYFHEDFSLDLSSRLALDAPTLPLADVLLIKLQRKNFQDKDIKDSIALLLDHRVAEEEDLDQISFSYIAQMTRGNWGRFHTVYDNTIALEKILPKYIEPEEAQLVWRRIELIQGEMDRVHKSFSWMINQVFRKPAEIVR